MKLQELEKYILHSLKLNINTGRFSFREEIFENMAFKFSPE